MKGYVGLAAVLLVAALVVGAVAAAPLMLKGSMASRVKMPFLKQEKKLSLNFSVNTALQAVDISAGKDVSYIFKIGKNYYSDIPAYYSAAQNDSSLSDCVQKTYGFYPERFNWIDFYCIKSTGEQVKKTLAHQDSLVPSMPWAMLLSSAKKDEVFNLCGYKKVGSNQDICWVYQNYYDKNYSLPSNFFRIDLVTYYGNNVDYSLAPGKEIGWIFIDAKNGLVIYDVQGEGWKVSGNPTFDAQIILGNN
ncbi:MAG: hypothetical protein ACP5O3_03230 [Candidatus Micrarchaeia archaeon]|jgi:hypothetical protein